MLSARPNAAEFAGDDDPLPVNFDFDRAPADALESLDARKTGERISWNWRDTWEEQHREAFVVAKMAKADMLKEVHDSLYEAMENGMPYAEWRKRMEASLQDRWIGKTHGELWDELPEAEKDKQIRRSLGAAWDDLSDEEKQLKRENWLSAEQREKRVEASRLRTIYYTNSIVSSQAGQYKQLMKQAEDYPYWRYKTAGDSKVRPAHRALHNKVFRYNDPFWDTHYPPNGWFCRCSVEALDDYDLKHLEGKEIKVEDGGSHVSWKTRPNGDKVAVWQDGDQRVECAPGWSYNVGRPGYRQQVAEEKAKEYPVQLRKQIEAESAKEDQEQSERTKKLEEIAKRLGEQRKNRERPRVEVVRKPQPSETPLDLQRQFREEEHALLAQHRGQERFQVIASGDRKEMRRLRLEEERALAELREKQNERTKEARQQTIDNIASSVAKGCGRDPEKAKALQAAVREKANNLSNNELEVLLHAVKHDDVYHDFLNDGDKGPGCYSTGQTILGVKANVWNTDRNEKWLSSNNNIDSLALGHELMHAGDLMAGAWVQKEKPKTWTDKTQEWFVSKINLLFGKKTNDATTSSTKSFTKEWQQATALSTIKEDLYAAAINDIRSFLSNAVKHELRDFDIENPSNEIKHAYQQYLRENYKSAAVQVSIQAFTDAVGLYSKGKLLPPIVKGGHFKLHRKKDCIKNGGVEGGNSELLAGIFGARLRGHDEMLDCLKILMPNVMNVYPNIIGRIASQLQDYEFSEEAVVKNKPEDNTFNETYILKEDVSVVGKSKKDPYAFDIPDSPQVVALLEEEKKRLAPFYDAEQKYLEAELGDVMRYGWDYAPPEAMNYPGGPVAVYKEAVRRGVTWEEVCGFNKRDDKKDRVYKHFLD